MKDNFSAHADRYAQYRPTYPPALVAYMGQLPSEQWRLWDCGTGNGQLALPLTAHFAEVYATDISAAQLAQAPSHPRIRYSQQAAETADFPDHFFDLIVVGQAVHWFDFDRFYAQVRRMLKPEGYLVLTGYGVPQFPAALQPAFQSFYSATIGPYWDTERHYIDEGYQTLPFPFLEINAPTFAQHFDWSWAHLSGYLGTWSAVKHFERANGYTPVPDLIATLHSLWPTATSIPVTFPTLLRVGQLYLDEKPDAAKARIP